MRPPRVIVNADDFGISPEVTAAIAACIRAGRVSSTTIMANMPGFEAACECARRERFADRIGVHLNLTCGAPLSEPMRRFCDAAGALAVSERWLTAPSDLLGAIAEELRAQLGRVVAQGIRPTHIDSHQHILTCLPYARVAVRVAREFGIWRMRLSRNAFYRRGPLKSGYKWLYNRYIRLRGMRTTRRFADVKPFVRHVTAGRRLPGGPIELMCHPGARHDLADTGFASETDLLLSPAFAQVLDRVQLISYAEL